MRIIPSITSAPQLDLKCQLDQIKDIPCVHIDVEGENSLPNIAFDTKTIEEVAAYFKAELDVYLSTTDPIRYIRELSESDISVVYGRTEAPPYPLEFLHEVRRTGVGTGLALGLSMPIEQINSYIGSFDYLLLVTSESGSYGQRFRPCALERIRGAKACIPDEMMIYADGGIGGDELGKAEEAGADCMVMGRAV